MRRVCVIGLGSLLLGGLLGLPLSASAQNNTSNPFQPWGYAYGHDQHEWAAEWVQWVMSIPAPTNPLNDTTGEFCAEHQSGKVWFLAGSWVGPVTRHCTIPADKALFFPIANYFWVVTPGDPGWPTDAKMPIPQWKKLVLPDLRDAVTAFIDSEVGEHTCEVDGVSVPDFRVGQPLPLFSSYLPEGNVWAEWGVAEGTYRYGLTDGYYVMLAPLPIGHHTVHIYGEFLNYDAQDVVYELEIVPAKK